MAFREVPMFEIRDHAAAPHYPARRMISNLEHSDLPERHRRLPAR
jgi:hypothetical protein